MTKIMIVDDDPSFNGMLTAFLTRNSYEVSSAHSSSSALTLLKKGNFDLVLTDFKLPDVDGLELIQQIKADDPSMPVILITNYSDIRTAVRSIKLGAYEYVTKPVIPDELLITVQRALQGREATPERESRPLENDFIIGSGTSAVDLWEHVQMVAPTNMSVLITGESGTGKEYVARMLWRKSKRAQGPFIAIDCGTMSKELAASELFGHEKGSFTGATHDKKGQFELAHKGTLFLDEIGNLPHDVQANLLRAIQERTIRRIGSDRETKVDVRIITATNEPLDAAISHEKFRNDLYHRLNEFELKIPPLRERIEDLPEFISFFLEQANRELNKNIKGIDDQAIEIFKRYSWPGNLRELRNIVTRATLLCSGDVITSRQIPPGLLAPKPNASAGNKSVNTTNLKLIQEEQEKETILRVLRDTRYNKSKAARLLNIDRTTLYVKIRQYGIDI